MPTVKEIERFLFSCAPKELAMNWDNVGLLVGETERRVTKILVSLDITPEAVEEAAQWGAELIVAHHPVMNCTWHPVQSLRDDTPQGRLLTTMIRCHIAGICMHTNLDIAHGGVNDTLAQLIGLTDAAVLDSDGCCRFGHLEREMNMDGFLDLVFEKLSCKGLRYVDAGKAVHRVAVGGGACWSYNEDVLRAGCDTFLTSDLKYHDFLDAKAMGLNVVDAGHFPTEDIVCAQLIAWLQKEYPDVKAEKSEVHKEVFQYMTKSSILS